MVRCNSCDGIGLVWKWVPRSQTINCKIDFHQCIVIHFNFLSLSCFRCSRFSHCCIISIFLLSWRKNSVEVKGRNATAALSTDVLMTDGRPCRPAKGDHPPVLKSRENGSGTRADPGSSQRGPNAHLVFVRMGAAEPNLPQILFLPGFWPLFYKVGKNTFAKK